MRLDAIFYQLYYTVHLVFLIEYLTYTRILESQFILLKTNLNFIYQLIKHYMGTINTLHRIFRAENIV